MAEFTTITEVNRYGLATGETILTLDVTPDAGTGTVTFDGSTNSGVADEEDKFTTVYVQSVCLAEDLAANTDNAFNHVEETSGTANQITFACDTQASDGTAASTFKAVRVVLHCIR